MKKLILVTQAKGGTGKSALTYVLSQQNPEAIILDTDDIFQTISTLLPERNPTLFSFLSSYKYPDRGHFANLFEMVEKSAHQVFICDLSPIVAHQLLFFLTNEYNNIREYLTEIFEGMGFDLELHIVTAGGKGNFKPTMSYLENIYLNAHKDCTIKIYKNTYFPYSNSEEQLLKTYARERNLKLAQLDIVDCF
jgi:hypothetical protein